MIEKKEINKNLITKSREYVNSGIAANLLAILSFYSATHGDDQVFNTINYLGTVVNLGFGYGLNQQYIRIKNILEQKGIRYIPINKLSEAWCTRHYTRIAADNTESRKAIEEYFQKNNATIFQKIKHFTNQTKAQK